MCLAGTKQVLCNYDSGAFWIHHSDSQPHTPHRLRYHADHPADRQSGGCIGGEVPLPGSECGAAHAAQRGAGGANTAQDAASARQDPDISAKHED